MTTRRRTIAAIDDDSQILESLRRLLRVRGYTAELFSSGEEFLSVVPGIDVGCLLLDVHLGGMTGLELAGHPTVTALKIPIIFLSASTDEALRQEALALGAIAWLRKPVKAAQLLEVLAKVDLA